MLATSQSPGQYLDRALTREYRGRSHAAFALARRKQRRDKWVCPFIRCCKKTDKFVEAGMMKK